MHKGVRNDKSTVVPLSYNLLNSDREFGESCLKKNKMFIRNRNNKFKVSNNYLWLDQTCDVPIIQFHKLNISS